MMLKPFALSMMFLLTGCYTHVQGGLITTREDAPIPGATLRTHGTEQPLQQLDSTPGSTLKVGPDAIDISLTYGLTYHYPMNQSQVVYLRGQLDVLNIGYDFGNPYPHIGTFGPGLEMGYLHKTHSPDGATDRWWSFGVFLDHDVRFGPGHKTYGGISIGYIWSKPDQ